MGQTLNEIAQTLRDSDKKVQLIYAFNGTGKTQLSREFKKLVDHQYESEELEEIDTAKIERFDDKVLYYNAFTEDLFYWDNSETKLKIQANSFTPWLFRNQGEENNITKNFQHYTNDKLTPRFDENYSEVHFSFARGHKSESNAVKISKGEESCFIWSIFYSLLTQAIEELIPRGEAEEDIKSLSKVADTKEKDAKDAKKLAKKNKNLEEYNIKAEVAEKEAELAKMETDQAKAKLKNLNGIFDNLEYVFIDDPVSSLDENHLIELAVNIAELIKSSNSRLKFVITTHNPLFYNILFNEFNSKDPRFKFKETHAVKMRLEKLEDNTYVYHNANDSPFSYHLVLLSELEKAVASNNIQKYHFNFLRNILEKTSTFFGHSKWEDLLSSTSDGAQESYHRRILNLSSHSKHSGEEIAIVEANDKRSLGYLVQEIKKMYLHKEKNEKQ